MNLPPATLHCAKKLLRHSISVRGRRASTELRDLQWTRTTVLARWKTATCSRHLVASVAIHEVDELEPCQSPVPRHLPPRFRFASGMRSSLCRTPGLIFIQHVCAPLQSDCCICGCNGKVRLPRCYADNGGEKLVRAPHWSAWRHCQGCCGGILDCSSWEFAPVEQHILQLRSFCSSG